MSRFLLLERTGHPPALHQPHVTTRSLGAAQPCFTHSVCSPSWPHRERHAAPQSLQHISGSTPRPTAMARPSDPTPEPWGCPGLPQPFSHVTGQRDHPKVLGTRVSPPQDTTMPGDGRKVLGTALPEHLPTHFWIRPALPHSSPKDSPAPEASSATPHP